MDRAITGRELEELSVDELEALVETTSVYARVSPEHKLKIVQALQNKGHIVAMTGDGVNDAPALKKADIGVAMGITGTDVSKEAADMVLLDDNFATIVTAVKEGRTIYDNIRKFIKYTMTSNSGEIWVMLLAPFLGMPLPLLPLQILWVNLVTDGLPGLALGVEPAEKGIMRRSPYHPNENIFGRGMGWHILWVGLLMGLVSLGMGYWAWSTGRHDWQTMVFTTLTLSQMGHALAIRSGRESFFKIGMFTNKALLGAVLLTFVLQLAVVYVPFMQEIVQNRCFAPHRPGYQPAIEHGGLLGCGTRKMVYPAEVNIQMDILILYQGIYGRRIADNLKLRVPDNWQLKTLELPKTLPVIVDDPEEFLPVDFPSADLVLHLAKARKRPSLLPGAVRLSGARAVIAPIDNDTWIPPGLRRQIRP